MSRTVRTFSPIPKMENPTELDQRAIATIYAMQNEVRNTMNTERSKKLTIGISEIGDPCDRCVCRKLSGLYAKPASMYSDGWKAQVGTFVHAGLEEHFRALPGLEVGDRVLTVELEQRLHIMEHRGLVLEGSCDFYATDGAELGIVSDWKIQGPKAIAESQKGKVKPVYVVQGHTYGLGIELLGKPVTHVVLYALPREGDLFDAAPIIVRYDRQIAVNALARIKNFLDAAHLLEQAFPGEGWERLIRAQSTASGCFDCPGYDKAESRDFFAWAQ